MRLSNQLGDHGYFPDTALILARHGVDLPILSNDLNQPLTEETKPDIRLLGEEIVMFCKKHDISNVSVICSNRLRAIQTGTILHERLVAGSLPVTIRETAEIKEVYQGSFVISEHTEGACYKPLMDAWSAWQKKLDAYELLYRFGDPVVTDQKGAEFPELIGWFTSFGEHQADFSLRLYRFLLNLLDAQRDALQLIISHQASCSRIQRIFNAMSLLGSADDFKPGEFVRFIEKAGDRQTVDPACGVIIMRPRRELIVPILSKEISYLEQLIQ